MKKTNTRNELEYSSSPIMLIITIALPVIVLIVVLIGVYQASESSKIVSTQNELIRRQYHPEIVTEIKRVDSSILVALYNGNMYEVEFVDNRLVEVAFNPLPISDNERVE